MSKSILIQDKENFKRQIISYMLKNQAVKK